MFERIYENILCSPSPISHDGNKIILDNRNNLQVSSSKCFSSLLSSFFINCVPGLIAHVSHENPLLNFLFK